MALKAAKRQTLIHGVQVAAEHAALRGELSAKLTKQQARRLFQPIGESYGFITVPYGFATGELMQVWAKAYAASPKRKAVTAQVKASVATAKPKTRTKKQPKAAAEAKVEQAPKEQPADEPKAEDERMASLEAKVDKLAEMFAAFMATK